MKIETVPEQKTTIQVIERMMRLLEVLAGRRLFLVDGLASNLSVAYDEAKALVESASEFSDEILAAAGGKFRFPDVTLGDESFAAYVANHVAQFLDIAAAGIVEEIGERDFRLPGAFPAGMERLFQRGADRDQGRRILALAQRVAAFRGIGGDCAREHHRRHGRHERAAVRAGDAADGDQPEMGARRDDGGGAQSPARRACWPDWLT